MHLKPHRMFVGGGKEHVRLFLKTNEAKVHATPSKTPSLLLQIAGALLQVDKNMLDYCFTRAVNWSING